MRERNVAVFLVLLITAGCSVQTTDAGGGAVNVSEAVVALAGPGQDLASARLMPEDGCYWYEHRGPVETTLLPLRTAGGNPICSARDS
ncbi:hypothetical protein DEA8626_01777 [Defluviimonas aquaemixtae]|uniref:Uncharacterized protein n=1 Tax=Albidovulum aquaemixtae TaxID=1542388 RepID=A0A2R8B6H9_9RHOB|nr:hypothetical protein [Defluviimonas aquaemixtae]SPH18245.1 hypothetical protein DEA8626_01777 [Defluviimonas aquaemixtae]